MEEIEISQWMQDEVWAGVDVVPSTKAYELYTGGLTIVNEAYSIIGGSSDDVCREFVGLLDGLMLAALHTKLEGFDVGEGKIVVQDRCKVRLTELDDGRFNIFWRGKVHRCQDVSEVIRDDMQ